jgi:hypothetical protein
MDSVPTQGEEFIVPDDNVVDLSLTEIFIDDNPSANDAIVYNICNFRLYFKGRVMLRNIGALTGLEILYLL